MRVPDRRVRAQVSAELLTTNPHKKDATTGEAKTATADDSGTVRFRLPVRSSSSCQRSLTGVLRAQTGQVTFVFTGAARGGFAYVAALGY